MLETKICQNCKQNFVIEPEDFQFYEKVKVPPPTFCPECRMMRRMAWRNERALYKGVCKATGKQIITCFAPDSGMTVYDRDYWWSDAWDAFDFGEEVDFSRPFLKQFSEFIRKVPMPAVFN